MKKFVFPLFMLLVLSCQNDEIDNRTPTSDTFDTRYADIEFGADGGKDTVNIPFDYDCYLHMVRNDSLYVFFYPAESDYSTLDSVIQSRSIITRPLFFIRQKPGGQTAVAEIEKDRPGQPDR